MPRALDLACLLAGNIIMHLEKTMTFKKIGLDAMLTPDNCALILIDHQPFQANGVKNIDVGLMINNVVALAKTAQAFNVPTLLTSVLKDRGGDIFKQLTDVFPEQVPIDRIRARVPGEGAHVDGLDVRNPASAHGTPPSVLPAGSCGNAA